MNSNLEYNEGSCTLKISHASPLRYIFLTELSFFSTINFFPTPKIFTQKSNCIPTSCIQRYSILWMSFKTRQHEATNNFDCIRNRSLTVQAACSVSPFSAVLLQCLGLEPMQSVQPREEKTQIKSDRLNIFEQQHEVLFLYNKYIERNMSALENLAQILYVSTPFQILG